MNKLTIEDIIKDNKIRNERGIGDGVHDVSDVTEILSLDMEMFYDDEIRKAPKLIQDKIVEFCNKYPDFRIGEAYQCYSVFLLSNPPKKFNGKRTGSGFNYGSSNLLEDCPKKLLVWGLKPLGLAEDD